MIKIICLGKIKESYLVQLIEDYKKRTNKYHKIEILELKEEHSIQKEGQTILRHVEEKDYLIACDIHGRQMSSEKFAELLDRTFINYPNVDFVIGSSEGLDNEVKQRANLLLSFSDFTMPHGLFRGVLLEQIYRAFKINNNEPYHK